MVLALGRNWASAPSGSAQGALVVYPNPITGDFSVESETGIERVEVYDIFGAVVQIKRLSSLFSGTSVHPEASPEYSVTENKYQNERSSSLFSSTSVHFEASSEYSVTENKHQNERSSSSTTEGGDYRDALWKEERAERKEWMTLIITFLW